MPQGKKSSAEQIFAKLREAEVELARGKTVLDAAKNPVGHWGGFAERALDAG